MLSGRVPLARRHIRTSLASSENHIDIFRATGLSYPSQAALLLHTGVTKIARLPLYLAREQREKRETSYVDENA
jgi:hypothetical protein